ncbi:MAG: hypothetical protein ACRDKG_00585 [Actinomycetota bacterium]
MARENRLLLMPGALGIVVASASAFVPLSYDEGNWLTVVRRMALGETLYRDITENKTPPLFWLVRALDLLPGPYELGRAVWLGVAAAIIAAVCRSFVRRSGWTDRSATLLGLAFGLAAVCQAVFVVNFELPAVILIIGGLTICASGRNAAAGAAVAAVAATFDLRALALLPGVVLFSFARGGAPAVRRSLPTAVVVVAAWAGTVLLVPDLRYSLIELNAATRGGTDAWDPAQQLYALLRGTLIPAGALTALAAGFTDRRVRLAAAWLLIAGLIVLAASIRPFDKYSTLLLPGLMVLAASRGSERSVAPARRRAASTMVALGLAVSLAYAVGTNIDQRSIVDRYERAAAIIGDLPFARFDTQPFLGAFRPAGDRSPAAVLDFLIADTSRRAANHQRVEVAIAGATVLIDDGALSADAGSILAAYRPLWRVFILHRDEFPCVRRAEGLTFRYRATSCPDAAPST